MPWYFPWSESIKKRACRYLLQHYLGDFLKEKLALDQLTVDLYNGKGTVTDVPLDVWALNEMLGGSGVPLELVDGFISSISVSVPWSALLNDSCEIEIHGLELVFAAKQKADAGLFDSSHSWSSMSMTTSIQLAQECLRQEATGQDDSPGHPPFEGLEAFAETIESVLARVKVSFVDTIVRFEHIPVDATSGVGIELRIKQMDYWDLSGEDVSVENGSHHSVYEPVAIAAKNFQVIGISLFVDEFPENKRTILREAKSEYTNSRSNSVTHGSPSDSLTPISEGLSRILERTSIDGDNLPELLPQTKVLACNGKQNIKIKLKQNEMLPGPKIDIEYSLGALNIFLIPRQLHLLIDAVSSIPTVDSSQADQNGAKVDFPKRGKLRSMGSEDYMRVEQSLQQQLAPWPDANSWKNTFNKLSAIDTSYDSLPRQTSSDEAEEEFYSMTEYPLPALGQPPTINLKGQTGIYLQEQSTFSSSPRSTLSNISLGGSSGSAGNNIKGKRSGHVLPGTNDIGLANISSLDESSDNTHLKIRSSTIIMFLLYRDPLLSNTSNQSIRKTTLQEISDHFFDSVGQFSIQNLFGLNADEIQNSMSDLCSCDHIRALMSALTIEVESNSISGAKTTNADLVLGKLAVTENLYDQTSNSNTRKSHSGLYSSSKLVSFSQHEDGPLYPGAFGSSQSPSVKIKVLKTNRGRSGSTSIQSRTNLIPKSSVHVTFGKLNVDLDITIADRIVALTRPGQLYQRNNTRTSNLGMYNSLATGASGNRNQAFRQAMDEDSIISGQKTDITVNASDVTLVLRFPVPDLRHSSDIDKRPWWRKSTHQESLMVELSDLEVKTSVSSAPILASYEIRFGSAKGTFSVPSDNMEYHIFTIGCSEDDKESGSIGLDRPRILICMNPTAPTFSLDDTAVSKESSPDSLEDQYPWMKSESSQKTPFSSQPVMYENEEMIMPGSIAEMNAFQEDALSSSKLAINCYLPNLKMNLHSSEIFELLYNRICGDLMLWQSLAPAPVDNRSSSSHLEGVHINLASHIGQISYGGDKFFMCKSAIRDISDTNSEFDSFLSEDLLDNDSHVNKHTQQSNITFSLHIDKGSVALFPPSKDAVSASTTTVTSEVDSTYMNGSIDESSKYGHVVLDVVDGHFHYVSGHKGQSNIDYMAIYANDASLFHSSQIADPVDMNLIEDALSTSTLDGIIHMSESSVLEKCKAADGVGHNKAMLSVAMKCTVDVNTKRTDNLVAVGLCGGTVQHKAMPTGKNWLSQLMDFMDIKDFPIQGYTLPPSVTTLHLHLWGCAVDYRPLHLPLRSLLTIENFSLSSNITPGSTTSILRIIIEDSTFHLSNKIKKEADLVSDYVPIMDMGMFELCVRLTDGLDVRQPKVDLTMSNNMLNIRTCSDSFAAFIKLMQYLAADGDLQDVVSATEFTEHEAEDESLPQSPVLLQTDTNNDEIHIGTLMDDAMEEEFDDQKHNKNKFGGPVQADPVLDDDVYSSGDEYCFLGNEQAQEEVEEFEPTVKRLGKKAIVIQDGFFSTPINRSDQVDSPADYPPTVYKYFLQEMSFLWQMYGGADFETSKRGSFSVSSPPKYGSKADSSGHFSSSSKNNSPGSPYKHNNRSSQRMKGGPGRDTDTLMELQLNKVRFQHEIYPEGSEKLYRDVLLIYDLELRDRLVSSQINKFLYQYSSEDMPKQSSANMVTIRLLVSRPEDTARSKEAILSVALQPIRMNVDLESLLFLKNFFGDISGTPPKQATPHLDVTSLSSSPGNEPFQNIGESQPVGSPEIKDTSSTETLKAEKADALFFKSFVFSPEVPIRIDYQGKYVSLEQGAFAALLAGLAQLNCSEIRLKKLCCRSGLLGADKLVSYVLTEWLNDIKQNQLQGILGGVGPAHSFVQLFQGVKDLFWMPIQQYRQDGRIVRGFQRGAHSFSTSTAMAVLELTNRLVSTIQSAAEMTFDMVSPGQHHAVLSSSRPSSLGVYPADLREGVANAYNVLSEGLANTATNIVKVATEEHEKKGMTGAVGGVLRQIPPTVVKPFILATEATSNVLGGARNQLAPDRRKEAAEKWKSDS